MGSLEFALIAIVVAVLANMLWLVVLYHNPRNVLGHHSALHRSLATFEDFNTHAQVLIREVEYDSAVVNPLRRYRIQAELLDRLHDSAIEAARAIDSASLQITRALAAALPELAPGFRSEYARPGTPSILAPRAALALGEALDSAIEAFSRQDVAACHDALCLAIYIAQTRQAPAGLRRRASNVTRADVCRELQEDLVSATEPALGLPAQREMGFDDLTRKWSSIAVAHQDAHLFLLIHLIAPFLRFFRWFWRPETDGVQGDLLLKLRPLVSRYLDAWRNDNSLKEYDATCLIITLSQMLGQIEDKSKYVVRSPRWHQGRFTRWMRTA